MSKLLQALGLPPAPAPGPAPAGETVTRVPSPFVATTPGPTGLGMRFGSEKDGKKPYDSSLQGLTSPANGNPAKPPDLKPQGDPKKQVDALAEAIAKTTDAVKRDQLVKLLRDALARIQPLVSNAEAKKQIDKLIDKGIDAAGKAALMQIIELVVGKSASKAPDPDKPHPTGPNVHEKDLGEHILKTPEIPFGKAPTVQRGSFEFRGLPKRAKAGGYIDVQVLTPHWFTGQPPATYLVVVSAEAYKRKDLRGNNDRPPRVEGKGTLTLSVPLPDEPGSYVVLLQSGGAPEQTTPVEPIELQ